MAHHVSDLVDGLDLTAFYALYEGDGRRNAPYEPRMMVKVLLYAYATGVFSSRRVARKLEEDVGFRVLAAGNFPQHRTLCEFRRRHLEDFQALFVEVVRLAQELGLARLGKLSIDGTKVRANASKRKAMSYDRMQAEEQRLESEVEALLRQADAVDEAEDSRLGAEVRGDDLPAELRRREERLAAIREAKARLGARAADDARPVGSRGRIGTRRAVGRTSAYRSQSNLTRSSICNEGFPVPAGDDWGTSWWWRRCDQGECPRRSAAGDGARCGVLQRAGPPWKSGAIGAGPGGRRYPQAHPTGRMVEKLTAYAERKWFRSSQRGSSTCWASGASACAGWRRCGASGTWCAWRSSAQPLMAAHCPCASRSLASRPCGPRGPNFVICSPTTEN